MHHHEKLNDFTHSYLATILQNKVISAMFPIVKIGQISLSLIFWGLLHTYLLLSKVNEWLLESRLTGKSYFCCYTTFLLSLSRILTPVRLCEQSRLHIRRFKGKIQCIHIFYPHPRLCIADFLLFVHCQQQFLNGSSSDTSNQNKFKILLKKETMLHSKTVSVIHISDFSSWLIDWCPS